MFPPPTEGLGCPRCPSSLEALPAEPDFMKALLPRSSPGSLQTPVLCFWLNQALCRTRSGGFSHLSCPRCSVWGFGCPLFAQSPILCLCHFSLDLSLSFCLGLRPASLF